MSGNVQIANMERRLAALERKIEQEKAQLKALEAKEKDKRRRAETRTKIVLGSALLLLLDSLDKDDRGVLRRAVEKHVSRKADRIFLGLEAETDPARIIAGAGTSGTGPEPTGDLPFPV